MVILITFLKKKIENKNIYLLSPISYLLSYTFMSILTPTQLKSLCQQYGLTPSKKYGQNYLINGAVIEKILKAADLSRADTVVEIGPGFGILTFALARAAKAVIAF